MEVRNFSNTAKRMYLRENLGSSSGSDTVTVSTGIGGLQADGSSSGWPSVPFFAVIDAGTSSQEVVKIVTKTGSGSGTTYTIVRGSALGTDAHGSVTVTHIAGASIYPVFAAADQYLASAAASVLFGGQTINNVLKTEVPLTIAGSINQEAPLFKITTSNGVLLTNIDSDGISVGNSTSPAIKVTSSNAGSASFILDGTSGTSRDLVFKTAENSRWSLITNTTTESGSNAGSNLNLNRYSDAGALLSTVIEITRSTGQVGINATVAGESTTLARIGYGTNADAAVLTGAIGVVRHNPSNTTDLIIGAYTSTSHVNAGTPVFKVEASGRVTSTYTVLVGDSGGTIVTKTYADSLTSGSKAVAGTTATFSGAATFNGTTTFTGATALNGAVTASNSMLTKAGASVDIENDISSDNGYESRVRFSRTVSGTSTKRWTVGKSNASESGSNAGANFFIKAYADDGTTLLHTPLTISRSTGVVSFASMPTLPGSKPTAQTDAINALSMESHHSHSTLSGNGTVSATATTNNTGSVTVVPLAAGTLATGVTVSSNIVTLADAGQYVLSASVTTDSSTAGSTLVYWQYSTDGGSTWSNISSSISRLPTVTGFTGAGTNIHNVTGVIDFKYTGSNPRVFTVNGKVRVVAQSHNATHTATLGAASITQVYEYSNTSA